ncbi:hypothetical protein KJ567_00645 [Candidatus Bipolaricaulota bacterium]|nr:hypothetical protein [Candidatus Bipolaricaulota bacterium]
MIVVVTILAIGGLLYAGRDIINYPWTERTRVGAGAIGTIIYVLGGLHPDRGAVADVLAFDLERERVSRVGDLPWTTIDVVAAASDGRLYVLGGYGTRGSYSGIVCLDPELETLESAGQMPAPRFFGGAASANGTIYYAGGWDGNGVRDEVFAWVPDTGESEVVAHLPVPVRHCAVAFIEGRLYVLGGEDEDGDPQALLVEIELESGEVRRTLELPSPISRSAMVASGGFLYVFGGWNRGAIDAIVRVSIGEAALTYEQIGHLSTPCSDCVALTLDERILLVGGEPGQDGRELRISEFDLATESFTIHRFRGSI